MEIKFDTLLNGLSKPISNEIFKNLSSTASLNPGEYFFYKLTRIALAEEQSSRQSLENIFSTISDLGLNGVYILEGDEHGVSLYFGLVRNFTRESSPMSAKLAAEMILKPSFEGNFFGSELVELESQNYIVDTLKNYSHTGILQGAVGDQENGEALSYQSVDTIINIMMGKPFVLSITYSPLQYNEIEEIENGLQEAFQHLSLFAKNSLQLGNNGSENQSISINDNYSIGKNDSLAINNGSSDAENYSKTTKESEDVSDTGGETHTTTKGDTNTVGSNSSVSSGSSNSTSKTKGNSETLSIDVINPQAQKWANYIEEVLLPRVDYGRSRGLFVTSISLHTKSHPSLLTLGSSCKSIFSGNKNNCYPLQFVPITGYQDAIRIVQQFQIPVANVDRKQISAPQHKMNHWLKSRCILDKKSLLLGAVYSTKELSLVAAIPQEEVAGIALEPRISFGLNPPFISKDDQLTLGSLVKNSRVCEGHPVSISKKELNKHVFVAGATGNGKTTTCNYLLAESNLPFMVIEPAKTEYRELITEYDDLLVFTIGREDLSPMRLNPLALLPNETISNRVDIIKAAFMASFDMEAAIPQIFEAALYQCYEKLGWNLTYSKYIGNKHTPSYPTLSDLANEIEKEVERQNFDERLKKDYIASINSRLQGLLIGSKGQMLNCSQSIDFDVLLDKRVVIELEDIRNNQEKSLLMGFVITNLMQAIKNRHERDPSFKHLTLIEEAHRLLANPAMSASTNEKIGLEIFSDMLAEIRKYGEGLIIVDQIPNKLMPEVIKSTNTKIIHKLIAKDDKDAVGNGMALDEQQQNYLSQLDVGHAVVFSQGWRQSVQVKIKPKDFGELVDNKLVISKIKYQHAKLSFDLLSNNVVHYPFTIWYALLNSNILPAYEDVISHGYEHLEKNETLVNAIEVLMRQEIPLSCISNFITVNVYLDQNSDVLIEWQDAVQEMLEASTNKKPFSIIKSNLDVKSRRKIVC